MRENHTDAVKRIIKTKCQSGDTKRYPNIPSVHHEVNTTGNLRRGTMSNAKRHQVETASDPRKASHVTASVDPRPSHRQATPLDPSRDNRTRTSPVPCELNTTSHLQQRTISNSERQQVVTTSEPRKVSHITAPVDPRLSRCQATPLNPSRDNTSPVPRELNTAGYIRRQTASNSERQVESASEPRKTSHINAPVDPRLSRRQVSLSPQGDTTFLLHGHPSQAITDDSSLALNQWLQRRHKPDLGNPRDQCMHTSSHTQLSAAQILRQDSPTLVGERLTRSGIEAHISLSESGSGSREHDLGNRLPGHSETLEAHSNIDLQHEKESSEHFPLRPSCLKFSAPIIHSPSSVSPVRSGGSASSPNRERMEVKISGRETKRIAHKSDREIKIQREGIEHKLSTPISPTSHRPLYKQLRKGNTTGSTNIRAELIKRLSKK